MKNRKITTKTDREWLLQRPQNIIGTIQEIQQEGFILQKDKFVWSSYKMVPAFFKIINEIIDNSVDVFIKSEGESAQKIDITITDESVEVRDNGYGIPIVKVNSHLTGETWGPLVAWGQPRAGSNFEDDDNQGQLGMNGIGSFATVVFSKLFRGTTCDSKSKFEVEFLNNLTETKSQEPKKATKSDKPGTTVYFEPDLKRFGLKKIDDIYKNLIRQRLINIAFSYPGLNFTFNGEKIKVNSKDYISKFGENATTFEGENYVVSFLPNDSDDFKFFAYTNGLANPEGGSQIDYFLERVINTRLKDRIQKRFKNIKAGDIKNKILMIVFFRNFKQAKFSGQSKEKFTSRAQEITSFLGEIDFDKMSEKIFQNKEIINPIIEMHKLKEEFERRKALKGLEKPQKRIDSAKYTPAIGTKNVLLITEGECLFEETEVLLPNFKTKPIKDLNIGDELLSDCGDITKVKSIRTHIKDSIKFKLKDSELIMSKKHRMMVYVKDENKIRFACAEEIYSRIENFNFLKSKLNYYTQTLVILGIFQIDDKNYEINVDDGSIVFATSNDWFLVRRQNQFKRVSVDNLKFMDEFIFFVR